ncbi:hypothetical protein NL676_029342 [Syzygium grande]|nr:hypothetical protein NL676_029342 [Syzygium grande]
MSCSSLSLLFFISLHIHFLVPASSEFQPFLDCDPFDCGDQQISYPFRHVGQPSYCGYPGYELDCDGHYPTLSVKSLKYRVIRIDRSAKILEVARMDLLDDICLGRHVNTTLNFTLFNFTSNDLNSTLFYDCDSSPVPESYRFSCPPSRDGYFALDVDHANPPHELCKFSVLVPISQSDDAPGIPPLPPEDSAVSAPIDRAAISLLLNKGFEITWIADTSQCENCTESGGICGYGWKGKEFNCFCADGVHSTTCDQKGNTSMMDSTLFHMNPAVKSLSIFYGCLDTLKNKHNEFECFYDDSRKSAFFMDDIFCRLLPVQMNLQNFMCGANCRQSVLVFIFTNLVYQALSDDAQ